MPFDFAMYLIKADECGADDVTKVAVSEAMNETMMTSQPVTCVPGKSYSKTLGDKSSVSVYNFSRAHIFSEEIAALKRDLKILKGEMKGEVKETQRNGGMNFTCKMEQFTTQNGLHCFHGTINREQTMNTHNSSDNDINSNNDSVAKTNQNTHQDGRFTAMLSDFKCTLEIGGHDDANCYVAHCHFCKGPKRALSIDSAKWRHRPRRRVSFADDNGMPLTKVRVMPLNPNSEITSANTSLDIYGVHGKYKKLRLDFPQPAADFSTFLERLRQQNVSLENVKTDGTSFLGTVRVKNLAMEKDVRMRFTTDSWETCTDIEASYVYEDATSCYDLFGFHVSVGHLPNEVEFAICYRVRSEEYWDNNRGENYRLKVISQ